MKLVAGPVGLGIVLEHHRRPALAPDSVEVIAVQRAAEVVERKLEHVARRDTVHRVPDSFQHIRRQDFIRVDHSDVSRADAARALQETLTVYHLIPIAVKLLDVNAAGKLVDQLKCDLSRSTRTRVQADHEYVTPLQRNARRQSEYSVFVSNRHQRDEFHSSIPLTA